MKICSKLTILFSILCFPHNTTVGAEQSKGFTVQNALVYMRRIIANFPRDNAAAVQVYEKNESPLLIKCAYALYNSARVQILEALREIDNRKIYWQYQRDHQWVYFLTKNPIKWITGQSQDVEIQNNLDMLESHQGELYTLLGQLLEQGNTFNHGYKTTFVADYKKGYEWVDTLLDLLSRVRVAEYTIDESSPFMARAMKLKLKLEGVSYFRNDILSDIKETQEPSKLEQNWLKYGTLGLVLGVGYNAGGVEKLKNSFYFVKDEVTKYVVDPVKNLAEEVFIGGKKEEADKTKESEKQEPAVLIETLHEARKAELKLANKFVDDMTEKYKIGDAETAEKLKSAMEEGNYEEFRNFLEQINENLPAPISSSWAPYESINKYAAALKDDYIKGLVYSLELFGFNSIRDLEKSSLKLVEEKIEEKQKLVLEEFAKLQTQFAGVSKLVLLTPAVVTGALAYVGYQQVTTKDYSAIRRALVDINSLFVDQSKPLEDERYGKMVYLLYNLKKLAEKDLPQKRNVRADFLQDLENIESKEFDVAAKRRIVDDMFRKYSFLGLIQ